MNSNKILNNDGVRLMEVLINSTQGEVAEMMEEYLERKYGKDKVVATEDYIYATGDIPIAVCAHMDTVFESNISTRSSKRLLLYDKEKNVMWCPEGAGFDDKGGIFAIIMLIQKGLRPHVILSTDEEIGCRGASALSLLPCPFEDLRYIIQIDRRGTNDCVFYSCANQEFVDYVEGFGFTEAYGTFTDITEYCPSWKIAGVNLSTGYVNEHTAQEHLFVSALLATISKVEKMLTQEEIPSFEYISAVNNYYYGAAYSYGWGDYDDDEYYKRGWTAKKLLPGGKNYSYATGHSSYDLDFCDKCKDEVVACELFPVIGLNQRQQYWCPECVAEVAWCSVCGKAHEVVTKKYSHTYVCPTCMKKSIEGGK